jgi:hypothetical protein
MAKSMSELKIIIKKAMEKQVKYAKDFENDKNPQVVAMYNNCKGAIEAYEAVLYYLQNGSKAMFDIDDLSNKIN